MTDQRLRQLERRWKETGAQSDGLAYLRACVRFGKTSWARLAFAGHLGDAGVRSVLGVRVRLELSTRKRLKRWCLRLGGFGAEVGGAVAVQAARSVSGEADAQDPRWAWLLGVSEAWLACPCQQHADNARQVRDGVGASAPTDHALQAVGHAATFAARWSDPTPKWAFDSVANAVTEAAQALQHEEPWSAFFREVLQEPLLPWALGQR